MKITTKAKPRGHVLLIGTLTATALIASACGSSAGDVAVQAPVEASDPARPDTDAEIEESPTSTAANPTPTSSASSTDASATEPPLFIETSDMVYMTVDGVDLLMDVFTPSGDGPWPVVVSFHGLSNDGKDIRDTIVVAEAAAAQGLLVFTPTWIAGNPFPVTSETFETWDDTVSCAVAFAQEKAPEYGGDPTNTVVDGFSAGAGAALLFASQDPRRDPSSSCETDRLPAPVAGFVIGDGEAWLHSQNFDDAFAAEPDAIQARLAALIGPSSWGPGVGATFYVWVSENGTSPRTIGDPADESGWFAQRDPDGSIRADLERLDQFGDGVVTYVDAGELLNLRLAEAGIEATLDVYPGGHTTTNKVSEIVGYLQEAAIR